MVLLEVPEGTVEIQASAYEGRTDITVVRLPASVKSIGELAFCGCSGITTLHLAEGLESIGEHAFASCSGIVGLHLPASVRSIGVCAFGSCTIGITSMRISHGCNRSAPTPSPGARKSPTSGLLSIGEAALPRLHRPRDARPSGVPHLHPQLLRLRLRLLPRLHARPACVLAPDILVKDGMADPAVVFWACPALAAGLTPFSAVKLPRHRFWHLTMHTWCTPAAKACVLAVLVAELRVDNVAGTQAPLPSLPHELWLLILEFAPRHALGAPLLPAV